VAEFCDAVMPTKDEGVWPRAQLLGLAADADGLVLSMADRVDAAFLERWCRLRVVSATLKGYDNFDADACARRGVWLTIVPDTLIVFSMENWALPGRPAQIPERLLKQPRTLFTPHLGSAVDDVRRRMSLEAARQVRQALEGRRPDHAVNQPGR